MSIKPGMRVGPYDITAPLGEGGMGVVFRAHDRLQRDVALKLLPDHFATEIDRLSRFRREAQVLASLNHPNIAQIYGLEQSGDSNCIVMELVEGETLADKVKRGPIPIDDAVDIAKQMTDALEAAHERGIIHRDLKPANIKLAPVSLTPDGKHLAYVAYPPNPNWVGGQLWTVLLNEESGQLKAGKPELFLARNIIQSAFSPDGKWLAYTSVDSGPPTAGGPPRPAPVRIQPEIYVRPFPASGEGGQIHISNSGGSNPAWSRNGELLYSTLQQIMSVKYTVRNGVFEAGKPQVWLANPRGRGGFALHPDGKRLAMVTRATPPESAQDEAPKPEHTVIFLQNFFDELKRRVPVGK